MELYKQGIELVTDKLIQIAILKNKNNTNLVVNKDSFTVQIFNNSQTSKEGNDYQVQNKLSIVNFDNCALELKKYYNFTKDVLVGKIDYDPKLESRASIGDIGLKYYSPDTGEALPFEKICNNTKMEIRFPIKNVEIDKKAYSEFISNGFNIYDSNSEFYNSRCKPLVNTTSEGDITLNERMEKLYKNISFSCGDKCLFNEIDTNNYTVCDCIATTSSKAVLEKIVFSKTGLYNLDIVVCYKNITLVRIFL